jgi:uncharacterized protein YegJ (DUF2314 family)
MTNDDDYGGFIIQALRVRYTSARESAEISEANKLIIKAS